MPLKDLITNALTPADFAAINAALATIESKLLNKMVNLTPEKRQQYGSINEQNKLFVNKVYDYLINQPAFNSPQVNLAEFAADLAARTSFGSILNRVASINEQMSDTKILHDNDNYQQALTQYAYISYLSKENVAGTTVIKEDLGQFFNSGSAPAVPTVPRDETKN